MFRASPVSVMDINMSLEEARQNAIAMNKFSEACRKATPKGMVYEGIRGEWSGGGFTFKPVYRKKRKLRSQRL